MPLIPPGKKAPAFTLPDQSGTRHRLSQYEGRSVVLFFYPKDMTSGCTRSGTCGLRYNRPNPIQKSSFGTTFRNVPVTIAVTFPVPRSTGCE